MTHRITRRALSIATLSVAFGVVLLEAHLR